MEGQSSEEVEAPGLGPLFCSTDDHRKTPPDSPSVLHPSYRCTNIRTQVRITYRLAEFLIPFDHNPLFDTEIYMYVLDAVPMFLALVALNIVHPGRVLVGPESNYRQGKKQLKAERKAAKKAAKARKKGGVDDSSDEEEASMIGMNSHTQGTGDSPYIPLNRHQEHGVVGSQQSILYDPHYGQSQGVASRLNV